MTDTLDDPASADVCTANSIAEIMALPPAALVTTSALMRAFRVADDRVIKRMVDGGELPPPFRMRGGHMWLVKTLAKHFEKLDQAAQDEAAAKRRTMKQHMA